MDGGRSAGTSGAGQLAGARLEPPLAVHVLSEMPGCSAMSEAAFFNSAIIAVAVRSFAGVVSRGQGPLTPRARPQP